MLVLAALPLLGLWTLAQALDIFDLSDPRMQGALDAIFDAARLMILDQRVRPRPARASRQGVAPR